MKVAIYSRKSLFTGKGESVENQIEMCKDYIKFSLPEVSNDEIFIYEDEGFSAKNLNRPQFQKMIKDIETLRFDYIVCYRLDRLSRNVSDFSGIIKLLEKKGVDLICIKEHFDTSTPMGRAMMYITSVFAQLERETLAERVKDNMHMLARTGRWLGGTTPTGYQSAEVSEIVFDGKIKISHKLVFNESEINAVKMMYEKFLESHSISAINRYLIEKNIRSRNGGFFSLIGIRDILQNPVYCIADTAAYEYFKSHGTDLCESKEKWNSKHGISAYNKRDYSKSGAPRNDLSDWIVAVGKHQGIISGKDWVHIQNHFHNSTKEKTVNRSDLGLLSGLIYCTKCGEKMFTKKQKSDCDNYSYICSSKLCGGTKLCDCRNLLGKQTDDLIIELLKKEIENKDIYFNFKAIKNKYLSVKTDDETERLKKEIQSIYAEIDTLTERLANSELSSITIKVIDTKLNEKQTEAEMLKRKLNTISNHEENRVFNMEAILAKLCSFKECFNNLSVFDKRQIIRMLIKKIEWNGENLRVFVYGE